MTERRETYAYFWVRADELSHDEITLALGLEPAEIWTKGDLRDDRPAKRDSGWVWRSPLPRTEIFIDAHLRALVSELVPRAREVSELRSKYTIGINCVGIYTDANPGFHLERDLIEKLSALGLDVDFDLYCHCSHGEVDGAI